MDEIGNPLHKTRAMFDRYDIIDEVDQRRALERQQEYRKNSWQSREKSFPCVRLDNEREQCMDKTLGNRRSSHLIFPGRTLN